MTLPDIAASAPDRPAIVMAGSGETTTFAELEERSNRLAHLLRARGLRHGDGIAIFMENDPRFLEVGWAARRAGLYDTPINTHLTTEEVAYIIDDCDAKAVVSSRARADVAVGLTEANTPKVDVRLMVNGSVDGWEAYEEVAGAQPASRIADEAEGDYILYSSGTTGRPKGIRREVSLLPFGEAPNRVLAFLQALGMEEGDVYLCPAPLYHSAPCGWSMGSQDIGATVVVMERFDAEQALSAIQRYRVTHAQWVPTMFVRMLKLPEAVRRRYDVTTLKGVVHAAAPCPPDAKQQMIEWWGPIIHEYWSSTEGAGITYVTSEEWLEHPGTVGKPMGCELVIRDDEGVELPRGEVGTIWARIEGGFEYHKDVGKTAEAHNEHGEKTVGDVGYLDEDGYLFLTDRKSFTIISGGVNLYPQETENVLIGHPKVLDVAVFGVPNPDLGEEMKAVVQPVDWSDAGPELQRELSTWCEAHLARYKCPRSIDFERELPRLDNGKLYKRKLRDRYWVEVGAS
jgi:acyl-CoA synthetase (AMP-forming)/AMP-acid ligase II